MNTLAKRSLFFAFAALCGTCAGCGDSPPSTSNSGTPPPHGGKLIKLSNGRGYVEVVKKATATSETSVSGEVSFYFYKDTYTPYSPAPGAGTITWNKKSLALAAEGDALVTPPGRPLFANKEVDGLLQVELTGQATTIPLGVRE